MTEEFKGISRDGRVLVAILCELVIIRRHLEAALPVPVPNIGSSPQTAEGSSPSTSSSTRTEAGAATGVTPSAPAEVGTPVEQPDTDTPDGGPYLPLPAGFPGYEHLVADRMYTLAAVNVVAQEGDLKSIAGIGRATERKILAELEKWGALDL